MEDPTTLTPPTTVTDTAMPAAPVADASDTSDTSTTSDAPTITKDVAMLPLSKIAPILRILVGIVLGLGGAYCALLAIFLLIGTIMQVPNFLLYSVNDPFTPLLSTVTFIGTIVACGAVCLTAFHIAHHLMRGNDLTRGTLFAGVVLLAVMLGCLYIAVPVLAAPFIS